jgi:hypothetical protein
MFFFIIINLVKGKFGIWPKKITGAWEVCTHFGQCVGHFLASKMPFHRVIESATMFFFLWSSACWHCLFSLLPVDLSFPPFFSLYSFENYCLTLFVVYISTSVLLLLISNFCSWSFYISFICFQFPHSISIYKYYIFQFDHYCFDF